VSTAATNSAPQEIDTKIKRMVKCCRDKTSTQGDEADGADANYRKEDGYGKGVDHNLIVT